MLETLFEVLYSTTPIRFSFQLSCTAIGTTITTIIPEEPPVNISKLGHARMVITVDLHMCT